MAKERYVQVGIGGRSKMYTEAITEAYAETCQLVGLCDTNRGRMELRRSELPDGHPSVQIYAAEDFDRMIAEGKPDTVIVTTPDCFHDKYIVRALELGCDAITEKPMTIDETRCQRIIDAAGKTGRNVRVTFNYRYAPPRSQVKELLMKGTVGKVLSVDFAWLLDTSHGADYYRRWHRNKKNSGGLLVHKATHHFDLVNWWISSTPVEVFAHGKRSFYGPEMAKRYGLENHAERCHGCPVSDRCRFFLDLAGNRRLKAVYLDQEKYDGYYRDRCVFGEDISIEDTMNLCVRYRNGVMMSYCLNSFSPWEGYKIAFNGTKGRLEHKTMESVYISGDGRVPGATIEKESYIRVYPHFADPYNVELRTGEGGHGGGDWPLLVDIFAEGRPEDPLKRAAGYAEGAYSILTGIAANKSMATGGPVRIDSLVHGIPEPNFTAMPDYSS